MKTLRELTWSGISVRLFYLVREGISLGYPGWRPYDDPNFDDA